MKRLPGLLGLLLVLVLAFGLAWLNGGQRVTLRLGIATFYRVPLTVVIFGSLLVGMTIVMVAGIRADIRVRRILREKLQQEGEEERARIFVDRAQQDLFEGAGATVAYGEAKAARAAVPESPDLRDRIVPIAELAPDGATGRPRAASAGSDPSEATSEATS